MSAYNLKMEWKLGETSFEYDKYSRDHTIYTGNKTVCASASPDFHGNPDCMNPEQAFTAAMASCHMLTFLAFASKKGYLVESYTDNSEAELGRNAKRKPAITKITLRPEVVFAEDKVPTEEIFNNLHDKAHEMCFIANSVAQCVNVEIIPVFKVKSTDA